MNMKDMISTQARLLREEDFKDNELVLVTAAGVIFGTPLFSSSKFITREEYAILEAAEMSPCREVDELVGDDAVFVLRDVHIRQGSDIISLPVLLVRFDAVIACVIGTF